MFHGDGVEHAPNANQTLSHRELRHRAGLSSIGSSRRRLEEEPSCISKEKSQSSGMSLISLEIPSNDTPLPLPASSQAAPEIPAEAPVSSS